MGLVMSLEFSRKQGFKLKKINRLIYMRNVDSSFNKKRLIEYIVEINCHKCYKTSVWTDFRVRVRTDKI